tara:strand:+ start:560 stop:1519 length:960 start_codon:yes stop_codon:yes gene_type:complete
MKKESAIYIAGHNGLVGSAVVRQLKQKGFKKLITVNRKKLDLRDHKKTLKYFKSKKIEYLIMAAAKAGGILANSKYQKDFFLENIEIQNNLLKLALLKKVKRVIFLGTSCIYPKFAKNPINESDLLSGELEKTNQSYAIAKIAGIKFSEALYNDHNLDVVCLMPTNIYGINDNFDKFSGHVIPAMINKIYNAKLRNKKSLQLLGTGKPIREFLYVDDLASAIYQILKLSKKKISKKTKNGFPLINVGSGSSLSIKSLSKKIADIIGYKGKIIFDSKYPDGTLKKNLNNKIIFSLGWKPTISLNDGLKRSINFYKENYKK